MAYPKKRDSRWFTTSDMRAINLDWVTDVRLYKTDGIVTGADIYQGVGSSEGQHSMRVNSDDAIKLFDLLV